MQTGYYRQAWNDIKGSPGWLGKFFLMGLLLFVPIFGSIVIYGYLYGWARDIAWGVKSPLPKKIFGNEDGMLYTRGIYLFLLGFVLSIILQVACSLFQVIVAFGVIAVVGPMSNGLGFILLFALNYIVLIVMCFAVTLFQWVGSMRISIYGSLSAGFQFKRVWAMIKKDSKGLLRIVGMTLITGLIVGVIFAAVLLSVYFFGFHGLFEAGINGFRAYGYRAVALSQLLLLIGIILVVVYLLTVASMWITALTTRALGYWTQQFEVPFWRGQEDPLPFEARQMWQSVQSYQGNQGFAGFPDVPGIQPPQDAQGFPGIQPPQDAQGFPGIQPPQDAQEWQETQALPDEQGTQEPQEPQGPQGTQGAQSPQGQPDEQAAQEPQGPQGPQGSQGTESPRTPLN
ncbi:MAG: DUF4013 domain-containing protein [Coriobacteriaceae bacterium]|jgi:hypothetical protein|nr:DUF4013 domain-containing protein [Coriobacteriaceae bacterium]